MTSQSCQRWSSRGGDSACVAGLDLTATNWPLGCPTEIKAYFPGGTSCCLTCPTSKRSNEANANVPLGNKLSVRVFENSFVQTTKESRSILFVVAPGARRRRMLRSYVSTYVRVSCEINSTCTTFVYFPNYSQLPAYDVQRSVKSSTQVGAKFLRFPVSKDSVCRWMGT